MCTATSSRSSATSATSSCGYFRNDLPADSLNNLHNNIWGHGVYDGRAEYKTINQDCSCQLLLIVTLVHRNTRTGFAGNMETLLMQQTRSIFDYIEGSQGSKFFGRMVFFLQFHQSLAWQRLAHRIVNSRPSLPLFPAAFGPSVHVVSGIYVSIITPRSTYVCQ